jgi:hypothetical protein
MLILTEIASFSLRTQVLESVIGLGFRGIHCLRELNFRKLHFVSVRKLGLVRIKNIWAQRLRWVPLRHTRRRDMFRIRCTEREYEEIRSNARTTAIVLPQ